MAPNDQDRELQLKFGGVPTAGFSVPAAVLTQTLQAFQRAVHILGMRHEGKDVNQRLRIPADVEARYALICQIPASGSFISPVKIGDEAHDVYDAASVAIVARQLQEVLRAVEEQSEQRIRASLPDPVFRGPVLEALGRMAPPKKFGVEVELLNRPGSKLFAPRAAGEFLGRLSKRQPTDPAVASMTVGSIIGRLASIDFDDHSFQLYHPATKRELRCSYHDDIEDTLLGNPRELIQVIGRVTVNDAGDPEKVAEVEKVLEIDLSPIPVSCFVSGGQKIATLRPLHFTPKLDDTGQYYCIEGESFGIDLMAGTREEIETDLYQELDVLWRQYACQDSARLTKSADDLKRRLLAAFEVVK